VCAILMLLTMSRSLHAAAALQPLSGKQLAALLKRVNTKDIRVVSVEELSKAMPQAAALLSKNYPNNKQGAYALLVRSSRAYNGGDITAMVFLPLCSAFSGVAGVTALLAHEWVAGGVLLVVSGLLAGATYLVIVPDAL